MSGHWNYPRRLERTIPGQAFNQKLTQIWCKKWVGIGDGPISIPELSITSNSNCHIKRLGLSMWWCLLPDTLLVLGWACERHKDSLNTHIKFDAKKNEWWRSINTRTVNYNEYLNIQIKRLSKSEWLLRILSIIPGSRTFIKKKEKNSRYPYLFPAISQLTNE